MSWFDPKPRDGPLRLPRRLPKKVVPSFIGEDGQVLNHLWHHGGGTRVRDYSGQGNYGDIVGATWLEGSWGWALYFDGNDYVSVTPVTPNWDTAITVETWFNHPKDLTLRGISRRIGNWSFQKDATDIIGFSIVIAGTARSVYLLAANWAANTWLHLICTINATTNGGDGIIRIYMNNVLAASSIAYAGVINAAVPEVIGARSTAINFLNGSLAFPRVYNRVLTASEMTRHFESTRAIFGV